MSRDILRYYNELAATQVTRNRLAHWNQSGASYFLTYRLADSLPSHLLQELKDQRSTWITKNPKPWSPDVEMEYHRLFSAKIDYWLDAAHGACQVNQASHAEIVAAAFHHFDHTRYLLHSFVVMPNHVHLLFTIGESHTLASLVNSWKRHTAREINKALKTSGPLWQRDYFDRIIRNPRHFMRVIRYIRSNVRQYPPAIHYESEWIKQLG